MKLTPEQRARQIVAELLRAGSREDTETLTEQVAGALTAAVEQERERCAVLCEDRARMWSRASEREPSPPVREEARCRSNEARFLADAIRAGEGEAPSSEPGWVF